MKQIIFILSLAFLFSCSEKEWTLNVLVTKVVKEYKEKESIKYSIEYKQKFFSGEDTSSVKADVRLIKAEEDSCFGGYIWFETTDSLIKLYDMDRIYVVEQKENKIEEFNPHEGQTWAITSNITGDVIETYFFNPEKLEKWINDTTCQHTIEDDIIDDVEYWKLTRIHEDDERYSDGKKRVWVNKSNFQIEKINFQIQFQGNYQYNEWNISDIKFNSVSIDDLEQLKKSYLDTYEYTKYDESKEEADDPRKLLEVGDDAPNFKGNIYDGGNEISLDYYEGKIVILDFWYISCYWCIKAIPQLEELHKEYKDKDVVVLGVNGHDTEEKDKKRLKKFLKFNDMTYPIVLTRSDTDESFGVSGYPTLYLIDQKGKIAYVHVGYSENLKDTLKTQIDKMLE